jgi:hypothetical protein
MSKGSERPAVAMPTVEEDKTITAAARSDPDAQPLGLGAGARKVFVWEGPELSKDEPPELRFSRVGARLLHPQSAG